MRKNVAYLGLRIQTQDRVQLENIFEVTLSAGNSYPRITHRSLLLTATMYVLSLNFSSLKITHTYNRTEAVNPKLRARKGTSRALNVFNIL